MDGFPILTPEATALSRPKAAGIFPVFVVLLIIVSTASGAVRYVDLENATPTPPYTNWVGAAITIQEAIDVASAGDEVLVTNGTYTTGGQVVYGAMSNRVAVTKPVTVRSVNGPTLTTIQGFQVAGTTNGSSAVRCVYLTNGAFISGFTLTKGATVTTGNSSRDNSGGGLWSESTNAVASNCVLVANSAYSYGGGSYAGRLIDCTLNSNSASRGGGCWGARLSNCTLKANAASYCGGGAFGGALEGCNLLLNSSQFNGGGACSNVLNHCILSGNSTSGNCGGGACGCALTDCALSGNTSGYYGGATSWCNLTNCTLDNNKAGVGGGDYQGVLNNCTIRNNSTAGGDGGGAYQSSLSRCTLSGNTAYAGGGAYGGTLDSCTVAGNSAFLGISGGGAQSATLRNCTVTGNFAVSGGGASNCKLTNCILYRNSAPAYANYDTSCALSYCCTTPRPIDGAGNFEGDPQLASASHLGSASPCVSRGLSLPGTGVDIDGEPLANPPSIGCHEQRSGSPVGLLSVVLSLKYPYSSGVAVGFAMEFRADISGKVAASRWEFGDGTVASNQPYTSHAWSAPGDYHVALRAYNLSYPSGIASTVTVHVVSQPVHYVALTGSAPVRPYTNWASAATNIQNAVDAATVTGALVLVGDGVYQTGSRSVSSGMYNRVAVTKPLVLSSVNGPGTTVIKGNRIVGSSAVRCLYLANGASVAGFTLTNGATLSGNGGVGLTAGGAVYCQSNNCLLANCVITSSSAYGNAAGVFGGRLTNCTLTANSAGAEGGAVCAAILDDCRLSNNSAYDGGGASLSTLSNCTITGNWVVRSGGAADSSYLNRCVLTTNVCTSQSAPVSSGGGASASTLVNCLVAGNHAYAGGGTSGSKLRNCTVTGNAASKYGGAMSSELNNCVLYYNISTSTATEYSPSGTVLNYCCTPVMPTNGVGNLTDEPRFLDQTGGDYHLQYDSPCINSGNNAYSSSSIDLDVNVRVAGGTVDLGAYEYQLPASVLSYAWAQARGLSTDGSDDFTDPDSDGFNNWQEWIAGTSPTDGSSLLQLLPPVRDAAGIVLTWHSQSNRAYFLERSMRPGSPQAFLTLATNIPGQGALTSFTDTNTAGSGPFCYRVGIMTSAYEPQLPTSLIASRGQKRLF